MATDPDVVTLLKTLGEQNIECQMKIAALELFCALLIKEAEIHRPGYVATLSPALMGFAESQAIPASAGFSQCVEEVLRFAEKMIAAPQGGPRSAV